jgi:hypothetical protein
MIFDNRSFPERRGVGTPPRSGILKTCDQVTQAANDEWTAMGVGAEMKFRPHAEFSEPQLGAEVRCDFGLVERNDGVGGATMKARVVIVAGRNDQNVRRMHFSRPLRDPVGAACQHANGYAVIAQDASGADADGKRSHRERHSAQRHVSQIAAQAPASELQDFNVRALNGVAKFLKTIDAAGIDRAESAHLSQFVHDSIP